MQSGQADGGARSVLGRFSPHSCARLTLPRIRMLQSKCSQTSRKTSASLVRTPLASNPRQVLVMGVTVWLATWARQTEEEQDRTRYVVALVGLTAGAIFVSLFRAILTFFSLVRVSKNVLPLALHFSSWCGCCAWILGVGATMRCCCRFFSPLFGSFFFPHRTV